MYKILFGLLDIDCIDYFAFKQHGTTRGSSGHNYCLDEINERVDARRNYVAVRSIKPLNSLPAATVNLTV